MDAIICRQKNGAYKAPRTFEQAKMSVENVMLDEWGEPRYTLLEHSPGFFIVTDHGLVVGKGVTFEVAIADFESNVDKRMIV